MTGLTRSARGYSPMATSIPNLRLLDSAGAGTLSAITAGSSSMARVTVRSNPYGPVMRTRNPPLNGSAAMREGVPVDITDVARAAGPHESYWNDWSPLPIPVDELSLRERPPVYQQARTSACRLAILMLCDKPFWELESGDPGGERRWIAISRWRRPQIHRRHVEEPHQLLAKPWLRNRLPA